MSNISRLNRLGASKLWLFEANSIMLDFKFEPILAYLIESKNMIESKELELKRKIETWEAKYKPNPETPDAYDYYEQDIINHNKFPELLNNSMFLVIYSIFENHYQGLCKMAGNKINSKLSVKDISSHEGYIFQCKKYMEKVIGLELSSANNEWNEISKYQLIRNKIAHNNSQLNEVKNDLKHFIKIKPGIEYFKESSTIYINDIAFLISFIDVIKMYFDRLNTVLVNYLSKV